MTINLQSIFISSLISEKNKWFLNKRKKVMFGNISMGGACRLFKHCHQAPLKAKYIHLWVASL